MNSRQYEQMRIEQDLAKEPKTPPAHKTLMRHLRRKTESDLASDYFNHSFDSIKEVKAMVKSAGWTWTEAKNCKHQHLDAFLDPVINVYLDSKTRTRYKKMFAKDVPFLFVRDFVQEVYWYPTLDDVIDFLETAAVLCKDPDHVGLSDIDFYKEKQQEDNGEIVDYYVVTFNLDS